MRRRSPRSKAPLIIAISVIGLILLSLRACSSLPVDAETASVFVVSRAAETAAIKEKLLSQDYAQGRPLLGISMLLHGGYGRIVPGGYRLNDTMTSWQMAGLLTSDPPLHWITIPEGLRREQVADRLQEAFTWDDSERDAFLLADVPHPYDLVDGFYFPDTYLIPTDEIPAEVAKRFVNRFNENFDPLLPELRAQNIRYNTAIKLASIIQREAGGKADMPLIAGVLWNRLLQKMKLEVDATLQFMRGDEGSGYWAPIDVSLKQVDSPYNTYRYEGLPPQPISNPGLDAINAVIHPEETECLFYLHDNNRQIHCSKTYEEHLRNIDVYLK